MNNNRKCRGTGTFTEFWREGMQDSVRANLPLVFFLISLPFMLSDSLASVACVCFWSSYKRKLGLCFIGELPKRAALSRHGWHQALGRKHDSKRNRKLKIQKQMVPSFFHLFFFPSSHLDTSICVGLLFGPDSHFKVNTLSLPYIAKKHSSLHPFLAERTVVVSVWNSKSFWKMQTRKYMRKCGSEERNSGVQ